MGKVVLDSSVLVKSILRPGRWLPSNIYCRELETHRKARMVIMLLRDKGGTVFCYRTPL